MRTGKQLATRLGPIALGWSLAAAILLGLSCAEKARPLKKGEGTRRMAARLDELIRNLNPINNQFLNTERAAFLRQAVQKAPIPEQRIMLTTNLADEMLKMGKPEEAIELILPFLEGRGFFRPMDSCSSPAAWFSGARGAKG